MCVFFILCTVYFAVYLTTLTEYTSSNGSKIGE